jgi:predicted small metal-binding protein
LEGVRTMRALDCRAPGTHDDMHFTANDDQELIADIQQHRDQYHTEITDEQIREMVTASAYDE